MEKRWLLLLPPILTSLCSQKNDKSSFSFSSQKSSPLLFPKNNLSPCASFALSPFQAKKSLLCFRKMKKIPLSGSSFFLLYDSTLLYEILSFLYMEYFISFFFSPWIWKAPAWWLTLKILKDAARVSFGK